jgi:hypothetical protein
LPRSRLADGELSEDPQAAIMKVTSTIEADLVRPENEFVILNIVFNCLFKLHQIA